MSWTKRGLKLWETFRALEFNKEIPNDPKRKTARYRYGSSHKPPRHFSWLASGATIFVIFVAQILPGESNPILRGTRVYLLLLASIFIFTPFYLLTKHGEAKGDQTYMQSRKIVDGGLYAITRHPQYLGYIFLACGFTLLSAH